LRKLNAPIELAEEPEAFVQAIDRMIAAPPTAELKAFAARHDWGAALEKLLASLGLDGSEAVRIAGAG
jgi:hypothetical protein